MGDISIGEGWPMVSVTGGAGVMMQAIYDPAQLKGQIVTGSGVNKITVGTTAPSTPSTGDLWVDTT